MELQQSYCDEIKAGANFSRPAVDIKDLILTKVWFG